MASTHSVCGDFVEPTFTDYGQCNPRRLKRDCRNHLPTVPGWPQGGGEPEPVEGCDDPNITTEFTGFGLRTIATIFDENCEAILDENGDPITAPII